MSSPTGKLRTASKAERKLLIVSVSAVAFLGSVAWWRLSINATPYVKFPPERQVPTPNGYDLYVKAGQLLIPANPAVDESSDSNPPRDKEIRAQRYSLKRKEAWLQRNEKAFQTFDAALETPSVVPLFNAGAETSPHARLRELARGKRVEAQVLRGQGDWQGSMRSRLDLVQMGNDTARHGVLIEALVSFAIQKIARDNVEHDVENLDARELQSATRRLEKLYAQHLTLPETLQAEKVWAQKDMLKTMREPKWRDIDQLADEQLWERQPTWQERLRTAMVSKQVVFDNYTAIIDAEIANARLPYTASRKPVPRSNNPFTCEIMAFSGVSWAFASNDAATAMWLVAMALQVYMLEQGSYPPKLSELSPRYLKQVPADPFGGGKRLRYLRRGSSYMLWSIGPDGIDNGGQPIPHNPKRGSLVKGGLPEVEPDSKGDFVWGKNQ